jgi:pimeloyl-ACP methyl ester carboxylesterase
MSNWSSENVIANGIKIHYHRTGGDKPPLVLSHGITDNGLCWTRAVQLLEKDYDVIMVDARGHGLSDAPEEGYIVEERAADLAGLIQALGLKKPYLMGHSMGADTTAMTAANYPDLVGCAILEDPPWNDSTLSAEGREARAKEWRATMLERKAKTQQEIIASGRQQNPKWAEIEFGPWSSAKLQVSLNVLQAVSLPRRPWREIAAKITCPCLLITGDPELGGIVTPETAAEAGRLLPHLNVTRIEGAGHNIRREQFEQFMNTVTTFLKELQR